MRTRKLATLAVALSSVLFYSCKKQTDIQGVEPQVKQAEVSTAPSVINGRVAFATEKDFFNTMEALGKKDHKDVMQWGHQFAINHLGNYLDDLSNEEINPAAYKNLYDFGFPSGYLAVLNSNGELQIGNEIVVYKNGYKYYIPKEGYAQGMDVTSASKKIKVDSKLIGTANSTERINFGANSLDARWQREFYQQSYQASGNRKFVHEIVSFTDYYSFFDGNISGLTYYSQLRLRIKMEWRGRRWQPAGETRNISYNLNRDIYLRNVIYPYTSTYAIIPFTGNISNAVTQSGDLWVALGDAYGNTVTGSVYWEVDLGGTIYQYVLGDLAGNAWSNTANPLW